MARDLTAVLRDQGRGIVGALLIGTPLLFTMETWWLAWRLPVSIIIPFAAGGLVVILVAAWVAGFRREDARSGPPTIVDWGLQFAELVLQSFVAAFLVLFVLGVIEIGQSFTIIARAGLVQVVPLGLGAALANSILREPKAGGAGRAPFPRDIATFAMGALFFALTIAPTEEIPLIAAHAGWWRLAGLVVLSTLMTYLALYELEFRGQRGRKGHRKLLMHVGETCLVYSTAVLVAGLLLAGFGHLAHAAPALWIAQVIVLAFPATMGGATAQVVA